jgi:chromosome segregation ATPase
MAKEIATKAGVAAAESLLRSFMPELLSRLDRIEKRFDVVDKRFETVDKRFEAMDKRFEDLSRVVEGLRLEFKEDLHTKFDQLRDVINEVGTRVSEVRTRVDSYVEMTKSQSNRIDNLIERVVRVEVMQGSRKRKVG